MSDKIKCMICGAEIHSVQLHLRNEHPETSIEKYQELFPNAELLSAVAVRRIEEKRESTVKTEMAGGAEPAAKVVTLHGKKAMLHDTFNLGKVKAAMNARGEGIPVTIVNSEEFSDIVPDKDPGYIFNIDLLKTVMLGIELAIPTYLWGHAGVGKSSIYEQIAAHTSRPYVRIQHTANTEESHIVGQLLANKEGTYWEPGPLQLAMKHGWMYNADEYDFASADVLAVYQAVLEGKPLMVKEAPVEWRVTRPHPNFRFVATGNTNGSGDESGLYLGTNIGNAANYSRFGITEKVDYMPKSQEIMVIVNQGGVVREDAEKLVEFATAIRKAYDATKMSAVIGPRELIYAAKIGLRRGSWRIGVAQAFINRLGKVDRETAEGISQRIFD